MRSLAETLEAAKAARIRAGEATPMERILALPRLVPYLDDDPSNEALVEKWTKAFRRHADAPPLRPVQAWTLEAVSQLEPPQGLLGQVTVGGGKTLLFLLLGHVLGAEGQDAVYLFPPDLRDVIEQEREKWERHYYLCTPHLVPYSILSRPESTALLTELQAKVILADECQALRHKTAARTKRFIRYLQQNPEVRFVGMTGTLTDGRLKDYAHLAEIAGRMGAPLPIESDSTLNEWASVLDFDGEPDERAMGSIAPLANGQRGRSAIRHAYAEKVRSTPGFVLTSASSCNAAIEMSMLRWKPSKWVNDALSKLYKDYELPNGDLLVDAMQVDRYAMQLSYGWHYVWDWPGEPDLEWVDAGREWTRQVRNYLVRHAKEGRDSPKLVEDFVRAGNGPLEMRDALEAWDAVRDREPPPTKPMWWDFDAASQLRDHIHHGKGGRPRLVWVTHRAMGTLLEAMGVGPYLRGGQPPEGQDVVLSLKVYHKGWNLQHAWHHNVFVEPPSSAKEWEQAIGRTHRQGQPSPVVTARVAQHTWPLQRKMVLALSKARTIQATTFQTQKILTATVRTEEL